MNPNFDIGYRMVILFGKSTQIYEHEHSDGIAAKSAKNERWKKVQEKKIKIISHTHRHTLINDNNCTLARTNLHAIKCPQRPKTGWRAEEKE